MDNISEIKSLLDELKATVKNQELEIERAQAVAKIQNCMGRYEVSHITPEEIHNTSSLFALWREDCSVEVSNEGVVFGPQNLKKYWASMKADSIIGMAFFHTLATPIIEVAGNAMTAKATWASPGFECAGNFTNPDMGPMNVWCWGKYAMDFIKNPETGEWKIWHMHWFRLARNDYDKSFTDFMLYVDSGEYAKNMKFPPMPEREYEVKPFIFHRPLSSLEETHPFPIDPKPYYDYDGDFRWPYGGENMEARYGVEYRHYEKFYNVNYPEHV